MTSRLDTQMASGEFVEFKSVESACVQVYDKENQNERKRLCDLTSYLLDDN